MTTSTAIATGSSSGLGNAVASEIRRRRWRVAGVSRSAQGTDWPRVHESAVRPDPAPLLSCQAVSGSH
jgi:NAD(P)-dependent dehydrogenase (short-subunit alcohol dehydrogenase family)